MNKVWKIIITTILVIIIVGAGYIAYSYYQKYSKKTKEVETLEKEIGNIENDIEEIKTSSDEAAGECDHGLTSEEKIIVADWDMYTSSSYNYSFKYPSEWTLDVSNPARINVCDEDGEGIFNVYSGEEAIMGFSDYDIENQEDFEIDCQTVTLINFSFDANGRTQVTSFDNGLIKYVTMFSYEYEGVSHAEDMQDLGKIFLKTMELN